MKETEGAHCDDDDGDMCAFNWLVSPASQPYLYFAHICVYNVTCTLAGNSPCRRRRSWPFPTESPPREKSVCLRLCLSLSISLSQLALPVATAVVVEYYYLYIPISISNRLVVVDQKIDGFHIVVTCGLGLVDLLNKWYYYYYYYALILCMCVGAIKICIVGTILITS